MKLTHYLTILLFFPLSLLAQDPMEYDGEWQNNKRQGEGKMVYYDGSSYEGKWQNNLRHGEGYMAFANGESYKGKWTNNHIEGQGLFIYKNGEKYEGQFLADLPHGTGAFTLKNGDLYTGDVIQGVISGQGLMTFTNGNKYTGHFVNKKMSGSGSMNYSTGDIYKGEWSNNQREGYGVQNFVNGDLYEGGWKNDKMFGIGILNKANGEKYVGEFNKEYEGQGKLTTPNGDYIEGDFKNGEVDGMATIWYDSGDQYQGEVKKGQPDGNGTFFYADGTYYKGELKKGQPDGMGRLMDENGEMIEGGKWSKGGLKKTYEQIDAGRKAFAEGMQALAQGMAEAGAQMQANDAQMKANIAANNAKWDNYLKESKEDQNTYNHLYQEELNKMNSNPYSKNNPMKEVEARALANKRMQELNNSQSSTTQSSSGYSQSSTSNNPYQQINTNTTSNYSSTNTSSQNTPQKAGNPNLTNNSGSNKLVIKYYDDGQMKIRYEGMLDTYGNLLENDFREPMINGYYEAWYPDGTKKHEKLYVEGTETESTSWTNDGYFQSYYQLDNDGETYTIHVQNSYYHESSFSSLLKLESPDNYWEIRFFNNGNINSIKFSKPESNVDYTISFDESEKKKHASASDYSFVDKELQSLSVSYSNGIMSKTSSNGSIFYENGKRVKYQIKVWDNNYPDGYLQGSIDLKNGGKYEPENEKSRIETFFKQDSQTETDLLPQIKSIEQKAYQLIGSYSRDSFKPQNRY